MVFPSMVYNFDADIDTCSRYNFGCCQSFLGLDRKTFCYHIWPIDDYGNISSFDWHSRSFKIVHFPYIAMTLVIELFFSSTIDNY